MAIVIHNEEQPDSYPNLTPDQLHEKYNELIGQYGTVRVVAMPQEVYFELVDEHSVDFRRELFSRNADEILNFKEDPYLNRASLLVFDDIFRELQLQGANNEALDNLALIWQTEIKPLLASDTFDSVSEARTQRFVNDVDNVLTSDRPYECTVTVSTSHGDGADIEYYKSLVGEDSSAHFGVSTEKRVIERAQWDFVSKRHSYNEDRMVETGRKDDVICDAQRKTFPVHIVERQDY